MLTSILQFTRSWFAPTIPTHESIPSCVPEWSEAMAEQHAAIWWHVKPHTATSVEQVVALCQSIAYVEQRRVPGAIVHCGVGKGGGAMAAALSLLALDSTQRQLYLCDTFTDARLNEVKQALMLTRYPWEKCRFANAAMPTNMPEQIALLRLDTDGFESTYVGLEHFYPRLADGGILIINGFGLWQGAQHAADIYFREQLIDADLRTIDGTGRLHLKCERRMALQLAA